jgi:hypothetical protein
MADDDDEFDDLFKHAEAHARSTDPWTSHVSAKETDANKSERLVWETLWETGDAMTTYDIAQYTGKDDGSITPRMKPLLRKGLVVKAGFKMGPRRKPMTTWRAVRSSPLIPIAEEVKPLDPIPGQAGVATPLA